jgi:hypothetical protein
VHWLATTGGPPAGTTVHVPTLFASTHDWQVPMQSLSQQTPCEQNVESHSPPTMHETPVCFLPHAVPRHVFGDRQSAVDVATVQLTLQAETPSHRYGSQRPGVAAPQCPTPSQRRADAEFAVPPGQVPAAHCVVLAKRWQAPLPSQKPSVPHVDGAVVGHRLSGMLMLSGVFEQVPSRPGTLHDLQVPWQALEQQKPCSQKPDAHSLATPQAAPMPLSTHAVPLQIAGDTQSVELLATAQLVLHTLVVVSHANEPGQVLTVAATQVPAPSQVRVEVKVAPLQVLMAQVVFAG